MPHPDRNSNSPICMRSILPRRFMARRAVHRPVAYVGWQMVAPCGCGLYSVCSVLRQLWGAWRMVRVSAAPALVMSSKRRRFRRRHGRCLTACSPCLRRRSSTLPSAHFSRVCVESALACQMVVRTVSTRPRPPGESRGGPWGDASRAHGTRRGLGATPAWRRDSDPRRARSALCDGAAGGPGPGAQWTLWHRARTTPAVPVRPRPRFARGRGRDLRPRPSDLSGVGDAPQESPVPVPDLSETPGPGARDSDDGRSESPARAGRPAGPGPRSPIPIGGSAPCQCGTSH